MNKFSLQLRLFFQAFSVALLVACAIQAQEAGQHDSRIPNRTADFIRQRNDWFYRGRVIRGLPSAELRRRAHEAKLQLRAKRAAALSQITGQVSFSSGSWIPLGPVPLASDASGNGTQDYLQVAGRATAVAIDPADSTGNTIFIGGAQGGIWKSTNAADPSSNNVIWNPISDDQATLSIGAIAIQPGNNDPAKSLILAATGEANSSSDSYFGLGILRSTNGGATWSLVRTANNGTLSFSGLGGTRMAFSTAANQTNTVVAAMATSSQGLVDGAISSETMRGLYTSQDAGQTWIYDALSDPGGATDSTSATSVVYDDGAAQFFAAIRYHGFYSSADGLHWTRLANQPGNGALSTSACPPISTSNNYSCPIYRGEISSVPGRNEIYAWYVSLSANGTVLDQGIWKSSNGGTSWTSISDAGITNCGDSEGCGVEQGAYNLELLAVANGMSTDLYAGSVNLYKCSIITTNATCTSAPFLNLTHAYGCVPISAPAHVHPDQHAMAAMIPTSGSDSGNELLYFANDGGIYRALNGYSGLTSGVCSRANQFDDLNQNLGSITQFVGFSQHPSNPNVLLGGAQGNGSPATSTATTNPSWGNVLGGDGAYSLIDPFVTSNFFASNPDVPPGGLGIQLCASGATCNNSEFNFVVTSSTLDGDDGGFYFPFVFDPASTSAMFVGTCRVWRGPRTGGIYTALSPNFDTLGSGSCSGTEVNQIRAIAAAGLPDMNGSSIIYVGTSGLGPIEGPLSNPAGGRIWVTTNASSGPPSFADVTENGPQGSINPNQYPISGIATDSSDASGKTAYVTVMGFTGGAGHVWKTTNAGASWTDFTANLPDSPANAVVVYQAMSQVFVATDVGVFASPTSAANWTELGPVPGSGPAGFLPNVAVTALGIFSSGGQQLLRASTYGRGIWQFNLVITPDFSLSVTNSPLTIFSGQTRAFNGTATALNGYNSSVALTCSSGTNAPPSTCNPSPGSFTPGNKTPFTVTVGGAAGDYTFNLKATGSDANHVTHTLPVTLHVINFGMTSPSPATLTVPRGSTSSPVGFQITAAGSFNQAVSVSCSSNIPGARCDLSPGNTVYPTSSSPADMTATLDVPASTTPGSYSVTLQAATSGASPLTSSFTAVVTSNPDFILSEPTPLPEVNAGSTTATGTITISAQDGYAGTATLACTTPAGLGTCSISPTTVNSYPATASLTIVGTSFAAGSYTLTVTGTSGSVVHSLAIPINVGDYSISGVTSISGTASGQAQATLKLTSDFSYSGSINANCDATALTGAICSLSPANPIALTAGATTNVVVTINVPANASPGTYNVKINTRDTAGVPSHSATVVLTLAQDFVVTSSTPSQTVTAGQTSGPYALTVQPIGSSFTGAVTLACTSGLPAGAQCTFNPSTPVTPGSSAVDVVMSISTKAAARAHTNSMFPAIWLVLPGVVIIIGTSRKSLWKPNWRVFFVLTFLVALVMLVACAGVSSGNGGGGGGGGSNPTTYKITVTGTSPGTPADAGQSTTVALVVD